MSDTTLVEEDVLDQSTARLLRLTANLLPAEITDHRRLVVIRRAALALVATVLVLLGVWYGLAWHQASRLRDQVNRAETEEFSLRQQQRAYSTLLAAQSATASIDGHLQTLLRTDVQWATLFTALRAAQPKNVALTGVSVALNDPTANSSGSAATGTSLDTASGLPSADGVAPIGSLTISGTSTTKAGVAAYLDAVGAVAGVGNTLLAGVTNDTSSGSGLQFTLRADLSKSIYSDHYAKSSG